MIFGNCLDRYSPLHRSIRRGGDGTEQLDLQDSIVITNLNKSILSFPVKLILWSGLPSEADTFTDDIQIFPHRASP